MLLDVVAVEVHRLGGEDEERGRLGSAERHHPAGLVVHHVAVTRTEVGQRVVVTEEAHVVGLGAEGEPPHVGVDAVGAHHEVEGTRRAALEGDVHAARRVGQRGDGVAEDVLAVFLGPLVQQGGEVAAEDLNVAAGELAGHDRQPSAVRVDDDLVGSAGLAPPHLPEDSHPLQHDAVGLTLEVDGLAAGTERGRPLDDGDGVAGAAQPVGERGPGDARTGDEDRGVLHVHELRGER